LFMSASMTSTLTIPYNKKLTHVIFLSMHKNTTHGKFIAKCSNLKILVYPLSHPRSLARSYARRHLKASTSHRRTLALQVEVVKL